MRHFDLFLTFKLVMIVVLITIQLFVYIRISRSLKYSKAPGWKLTVVRSVFLAFNLPLVVLIFWIPKIITTSRLLTSFFVTPFYVWHFSFFMFGLLLLAASPFYLLWRAAYWLYRSRARAAIPGLPPPSSESIRGRRLFLKRGMAFAAVSAFGGSTYGAFRKDAFESTAVTVPMANLPPRFEGFTIAFISDIHSSVFMPVEQMAVYVRELNAMKTDMTVVAGDFVNSQVEEVFPFAEAFHELKAPSGVFGVLGNHDYYTRNVDEVARRVEDCGIRLLVNDQAVLERDGQRLVVIGSDDIGTHGRAELVFDRMFSRLPPGTPNIFICHRPYFFPVAEQRGAQFMLSGHTHGGQIVFGKFNDTILSSARLASPYVAGMYSTGQARMYVSRGVGTVGVPIRINCPPEITKITLTRG